MRGAARALFQEEQGDAVRKAGRLFAGATFLSVIGA
jgi:hypothetical protein